MSLTRFDYYDDDKDKDVGVGEKNHQPYQGGRTWQPFIGGKNGHENFCQAHISNFRHKCIVFARNHKFANLTQ